MKARRLIDSASFEAPTVRVMGQAFEQAWAQIAPNFGIDFRDIEKARMRLAEAVISVTADDSRDVDKLKNGALQAMALGYVRRRDRALG